MYILTELPHSTLKTDSVDDNKEVYKRLTDINKEDKTSRELIRLIEKESKHNFDADVRILIQTLKSVAKVRSKTLWQQALSQCKDLQRVHQKANNR
jgi:predicted RND superfamily exporter protein